MRKPRSLYWNDLDCGSYSMNSLNTLQALDQKLQDLNSKLTKSMLGTDGRGWKKHDSLRKEKSGIRSMNLADMNEQSYQVIQWCTLDTLCVHCRQTQYNNTDLTGPTKRPELFIRNGCRRATCRRDVRPVLPKSRKTHAGVPGAVDGLCLLLILFSHKVMAMLCRLNQTFPAAAIPPRTRK